MAVSLVCFKAQPKILEDLSKNRGSRVLLVAVRSRLKSVVREIQCRCHLVQRLDRAPWVFGMVFEEMNSAAGMHPAAKHDDMEWDGNPPGEKNAWTEIPLCGCKDSASHGSICSP